MADVSKLTIESGTYNIKDAEARSNISSINNRIDDIIENKFNINSIKEELYQSPLLMIKAYINGTSGDYMSLQGMTVKYDESDNPEKIFVWGDYSTYSRLYIATCGNRENGSGWTYTYSDNVPTNHGSCISYKDGKILLASNTTNGHYYIYDIANDSYTEDTIPDIDYALLGIVWDDESETYLVCANNNKDMYVLDKDMNIINHYTHDVDYITNRTTYLMQSYDYKYGYEFRTISGYPNGNFVATIDTTTGKLLKMSNIMYINGEVESINVKNGYAILGFNNLDSALNLIYMHSITECYIGGYNDTNYFKYMQYRMMMCNHSFINFGGSCNDINHTIYYANNHNNSDIIRYCGVGTTDNPIKSGLALGVFISSWSNLLNKYQPTINIQASTNTDDNGIVLRKCPVEKVYIVGNNNDICYFDVDNVNFDIININIIDGDTRRTNGLMSIYNTSVNSRIRGTNTALALNMECNNIIGIYDTGLAVTNRAFIRRNTIVNLSKITAGTLEDSENLDLTTLD